jgi:hypothetical protein
VGGTGEGGGFWVSLGIGNPPLEKPQIDWAG